MYSDDFTEIDETPQESLIKIEELSSKENDQKLKKEKNKKYLNKKTINLKKY